MPTIDPQSIERTVHALDRTIRDLMAQRDALAGLLPGRRVEAGEYVSVRKQPKKIRGMR